MGVEALITNAYIFSQSRQFRERALNEGLHKVLDFNGVIMTDSGSFQLSVYGQVSITNTETLSFQRDIRSDIWVPLDIPHFSRVRSDNHGTGTCGHHAAPQGRQRKSSAATHRLPVRCRAVSSGISGNVPGVK